MEERIENPFCHMLVLSLLYGHPEKKLSRMHISQVHRVSFGCHDHYGTKEKMRDGIEENDSALMIGACCENDSEF